MFEQIKLFLSSPPLISVTTFVVGVYCLLASLGITTKIQIGKLSAPSPATKKGQIMLGILGGAFIISSIVISIQIPIYKTAISKKLIYDGFDAKQIVVDGEDVYLLKDNGNIFRVSRNTVELVDSGTGTKQIAPAGGALYILKNNGNIWTYISVTGRNKKEQSLKEKEENAFRKKDYGAGTKQIAVTGETLYILKNNGNIYKYLTRPSKENADIIYDEFVLVDPGKNTKQIASSGSVLYILKESGNIWQYVPTQSGPKGKKPFENIYNKGDARTITAEGGTLYIIRNDGSAWKFKKELFVIEIEAVSKKIVAAGGVVYLLTNKNEIYRYSAINDSLRKLKEAGSDNIDIAAYGHEVFAIKFNGIVWRYSEFFIKR